MAKFVVLYGGKVEHGTLNLDSLDRCREAIREVWKDTDNTKIIFTVDEVIPLLRKVTLECLIPALPHSRDSVIEYPEAHDSLGETKAAIHILKKYRANEVTVVTSWYHMKRVVLLWKLLGWKGKINQVVAKKTQHPIFSLLWEVAAYAKLGLNIMRGRLRTTASR